MGRASGGFDWDNREEVYDIKSIVATAMVIIILYSGWGYLEKLS